MPPPKKINPADWKRDPGGRRNHLLFVPDDSVIAMSDEEYKRIADQLPDEETAEIEDEESDETRFLAALGDLHRQIEGKDEQIAELTFERDTALEQVKTLQKELDDAKATPAPAPPSAPAPKSQPAAPAAAAPAPPAPAPTPEAPAAAAPPPEATDAQQ